MSDTDTTTDTTIAPPPAQEAPVETFSKEYVQELRNEAAKYRNEKKEAVEAAKLEASTLAIQEYEGKAALAAEQMAAVGNELSSTKLELLKLKSVLAAEIPSVDVLEVAALVQGSDEETISASVERVKALLGKAPTRDRAIDPSQGTGNTLPLNGDPLLDSLRKIVGAR
jgi:hypothetical protein